MAQARESAEYARHSMIAAILYGNFRAKFAKGKQPKALTPNDFNPYAPKEQPIPGTIEDFKALLRIPKRKKPRAHPQS
jgi:hypothetical protein